MHPDGVLLCPPDHFDIVDVKNPFMAGQTVDRGRARTQWDALRATFEKIGLRVDVVEATPDCEDMVFTANPTFTGPGRCVVARMRHTSRRREVTTSRSWFAERGDEIFECPAPFEGGGDGVWHPDGGAIFLGVGPRTSSAAAGFLADTFDVPVIALALATDDFYHLDTCFCPLDRRRALLHSPALADATPVHDRFEEVIEVSADDAKERMACNALAWRGHVVIQRGSAALVATLRSLGYDVHEVDTGEFMKSGGSVFCLKQWTFGSTVRR